MAPSKRPLVIELEPGHDPPSGRVSDDAGVRQPFTGWLGLATALGRALRAGASDRERSCSQRPRAEQGATGNPSTERTGEQRCD